MDWPLGSIAPIPRESKGIANSIISRKVIKAYEGQDADVDKYVERVKAFIGKPLDGLRIEDVRAIREKKLVKLPCRLEIPVFYELTGRLPHEELKFNERDLIVHFYNTSWQRAKSYSENWLGIG